MTDINDIRREIDGLHKQSTRTAREFFMSECAAHWPTISRALAEAEADRRKARAFDAIANRSMGIQGEPRDGQPGWLACLRNGQFVYHFDRDLLTAIEAALAAKEQA